MSTDLNKFKTEIAIYMPSISPVFCKNISPDFSNPEDTNVKSIVDPTKDEEFGWLNPEDKFFYPWNLYSAGHAELEIEKTKVKERYVHERNKDETLVIGDSGGFQLATGKLKFDFSEDFKDLTDVKDPEERLKLSNEIIDKIKSNDYSDLTLLQCCQEKREQLLNWLEFTTDLVMTLDYPAWAIESNKDNLKSFEYCLHGSVYNLEFYKNNIKDAENTKFLNVLHGRNSWECDRWYEVVKDYKFNGWAFSRSATALVTWTRFLTKMRDDNAFDEGRDWIHVLGVSKLTGGLALSAIQRAMRKHVNPNIQISYDAASPFLSVAFGGHYTGDYEMNADKVNILSTPIISGGPLTEGNEIRADQWLKGQPGDQELFPYDNPCPRKWSDFLHTKQKYLWTRYGYTYLMYHNVYTMVQVIEDANKHYNATIDHQELYGSGFPTYEGYRRPPDDLVNLYFAMDEIFDPKNDSAEMIAKHKVLLDGIMKGEIKDTKVLSEFGDEKMDDMLTSVDIQEGKKEMEKLLEEQEKANKRFKESETSFGNLFGV